ncbi:MAG: hypothetical protein IJA22_03965 [Clostridia bacterium]|nr:hypothetical protein [Clostridia bacterium]
MKIIYTSMLGCPKTVNSKVTSEKISNANGFVDVLQSMLKQPKKLMFITNRWQSITPKDQPRDEVFNDYHYTNQEYANAVRDCYDLSGIRFAKMVVVDCDYDGDFKEDLHSADMVFVQGGHTPRGLKILKDLHFEDYVKNYNGVLLLTGTATKLSASKVLSTHHGNMKEYEIEEGLCLKSYSIRPYFAYRLSDKLNKKFRIRIKLLKDFSKTIDVYGIGAESFIVDDEINIKIYGDCWLIKNKQIKKICGKNKIKIQI